MVDDFVAGGMENSSATTNTSASLIHPKLAPEYFTGEDDLISHELGHQWFGDLVTCKDWGDVWLTKVLPLSWKPCGPKRTSARIKPITSAGTTPASGSEAAISGTSRSCATTSTIPANSTAMRTARADGFCTCSAISSVKTLFTVR